MPEQSPQTADAPDTEQYFALLESQPLTSDGELALAGLRRAFEQQQTVIDTSAATIQEKSHALAAVNEELAKKEAELVESKSKNHIDDLTGLPNAAAIKADITTWSQEQQPPAHDSRAESQQPHNRLLIIGDLDNFKLVNDTLGHYDGGDEALKLVTRILQESIRDTDQVYRLGGDEFAIVALVTPGEEKAAFEAIALRFYHILETLQAYALERSVCHDSSERGEAFDTSAWQLDVSTAEAIRVLDATFAMGIFHLGDTEDEMADTLKETMDEMKRMKDAAGKGMR